MCGRDWGTWEPGNHVDGHRLVFLPEPVPHHLNALKELASILVDEEWHLRNGPDEGGAYQAQLATLFLLGMDPGRLVANDVRRSMRVVVAAQRRAAKPSGIAARR